MSEILVAEIYYKALKHIHTGYAKVTFWQLLNHLVTTYAAIDQFDLEKNQEKMMAWYDPNAPIETLFEQITDGVAYAEWGTHLSRPKKSLIFPSSVWQKRGCFTTTLRSGIVSHPSAAIGTPSECTLRKRIVGGRQTFASPQDNISPVQTPWG